MRSNARIQKRGERLFTVTHPFHPLSGRSFKAIATGHGWFEERVWFDIWKGKTRAIPLSWTDLAPPNHYLEMGRGRSLFMVEDLLILSSVIDEVKK